ncbi:hypothetical protein [Pseudomonas sp. SJZ101]|nr:hypothetical protein [Pseudomonas sp. SJZ101]
MNGSSSGCSVGSLGAGPDAVAVGAAALMILAEISPDYEALLKMPL